MRLSITIAFLLYTGLAKAAFADAPFFDPEGNILADDHVSYRGGCIPGPISKDVDYYYRDTDLESLNNKRDISSLFAEKIKEDKYRNPTSFSALGDNSKDLQEVMKKSLQKTQVIINATIFPAKPFDLKDMLVPGGLLSERTALSVFTTLGIPVKRKKKMEEMEFPRTDDPFESSPDCKGYYVEKRNPIDCYMETYSFKNRDTEEQKTRLVILHISLYKLLDWSRGPEQVNLSSDKPPVLEALGTSEQITRNMQWCFNRWFYIFTPLTGNTEAQY